METTPEDNSHSLLKNIVSKQQELIGRQNERIGNYIAVIDLISNLCRAKGIEIPLDNIAAILQSKTDEERQMILIQYKTRLIHEVLDDFEKEMSKHEQQTCNYPDGFSSPEWDDGVYSPEDEVEKTTNMDITKWKVFNRKWRLFGNG